MPVTSASLTHGLRRWTMKRDASPRGGQSIKLILDDVKNTVSRWTPLGISRPAIVNEMPMLVRDHGIMRSGRLS